MDIDQIVSAVKDELKKNLQVKVDVVPKKFDNVLRISVLLDGEVISKSDIKLGEFV